MYSLNIHEKISDILGLKNTLKYTSCGIITVSFTKLYKKIIMPLTMFHCGEKKLKEN